MLPSQPSKDGLWGTMLQAPEPCWVMPETARQRTRKQLRSLLAPLTPATKRNNLGKGGRKLFYVITENRVRIRVGQSKGLS